METKDLDIVYCIKDDDSNEELRYSLRSLVNLPHKKVWIYGKGPAWLNDEKIGHIKPRQDKGHKWFNARYMLEKIANNKDITEDFIWFNDDFFVMKPQTQLYPWKDRTLEQRANDFSSRLVWGSRSKYGVRLLQAAQALKEKDKPTLNYELHLPIIFNRKKLKQCCKEFEGVGCIRSLYQNLYAEEPIQRYDVKIYDGALFPNPDIDFLSTTDATFKSGKVGYYIRNKFKVKSQYEKEENG